MRLRRHRNKNSEWKTRDWVVTSKTKPLQVVSGSRALAFSYIFPRANRCHVKDVLHEKEETTRDSLSSELPRQLSRACFLYTSKRRFDQYVVFSLFTWGPAVGFSLRRRSTLRRAGSLGSVFISWPWCGSGVSKVGSNRRKSMWYGEPRRYWD